MRKNKDKKKCHEFIHWQYLLYNDHSSDVFALCSTVVNMGEIPLLNSCLGLLPDCEVQVSQGAFKIQCHSCTEAFSDGCQTELVMIERQRHL